MLQDFQKFLDEELGIDDEIDVDTSLRDDLAIDSLAATQLALSIEERYDIKIEQAELARLKTVGDCLKLLEDKGVKDVSE